MKKKTVKERLDVLRKRIDESQNPENITKKNKKRKVALAGAILGGILTIGGGFAFRDYIIKRQDYPVRNVLYSTSNVTNLSGNKGEGSSQKADRELTIQYFSGSGIESKTGTYLFETKREIRGNTTSYSMNNSQKILIAVATERPERFQAGIRLNGALNYREQFAQIIADIKENIPKKYTVYKIAPERGLEERDIDVVDNPNGSRIIINRLIEGRTFPLGWLFGKERFRSGTFLEDYVVGWNNEDLSKKIFEKIRELDSDQSTNLGKREGLVEDVLKMEKEMRNITIYASFEDGLFKFLPTESTVYLGYFPTKFERFKNGAGFGRHKHIRLRVGNQWDIWPGYYPILSGLSFGSGKDSVYPFDKYNNGGYTISDKFGELAKIKIEDFILKYGQDVLYKYYLDLNGDGRIEESELIGTVLCNMSHDERRLMEHLIGESDSDTDITYSINYSFMAPDNDLRKGMEYLKYCAYIESMIPDQVHRGNGRQSLLGLINDQRSDIMFFHDLNIGNLSRALTQESTLAAKYDIIKILNVAQRPYARDLAKIYGIEGDFEGQYRNSSLLQERTEIGPLPGISLGIFLIGGAGYYVKRWFNRKKEEPKKRLQEFRERVVTN